MIKACYKFILNYIENKKRIENIRYILLSIKKILKESIINSIHKSYDK